MSTAAIVVATDGDDSVINFTYNENGIDGNLVPVTIASVAGSVLAADYGVTTPGVVTITPTAAGTIASFLTSFNGVKAATTITGDASDTFADGDTIQIGGQVYTFKTTLSTGPTVPYQVLIGATGSTDAALTNLGLALSNGATIGTNYSLGTLPHANVVPGTVSGHNLVLTAVLPGTSFNLIKTVVTSTDSEAAFSDVTLGGASATPGVDPLDKHCSSLFTAAGGSGVDTAETVIAAAGTFTSASAGGTLGVGTAYDTAVTAMAAGWILPDNSIGAIVIENDNSDAFRINGVNGNNTITDYQAYVYDLQHGGQRVQQAHSAANLLTACKTYAIQKAAKGQARKWSPNAWYSPALYTK